MWWKSVWWLSSYFIGTERQQCWWRHSRQRHHQSDKGHNISNSVTKPTIVSKVNVETMWSKFTVVNNAQRNTGTLCHHCPTLRLWEHPSCFNQPLMAFHDTHDDKNPTSRSRVILVDVTVYRWQHDFSWKIRYELPYKSFFSNVQAQKIPKTYEFGVTSNGTTSLPNFKKIRSAFVKMSIMDYDVIYNNFPIWQVRASFTISTADCSKF
jgi:hypothetical protein